MRERLNMNKYGKSQHGYYLMKIRKKEEESVRWGRGLEGLLVSVSAN